MTVIIKYVNILFHHVNYTVYENIDFWYLLADLMNILAVMCGAVKHFAYTYLAII